MTKEEIERLSKDELRFMRLGDVKKMTGLSKSAIYRMMEEGTFPRQYKLGEKAVGWRESEVLDWNRSIISRGRRGANEARRTSAI